MGAIYGLIKFSSLIIRQFLLPNPFEVLENGILYNWAASGILLPITFIMVGFLYESGTAPFIGSLLFFVFYLTNTLILWVCSIFSFNIFACITLGLAYMFVFIIIVRFKNSVMEVY